MARADIRHLGSGLRDVVVPVLLEPSSTTQVTGLRLYPPANVDWKLLKVRYELVKAIGASEHVLIDMANAAGNAVITQADLAGALAIGSRGSFTLTTTTDRLFAHGSAGNAYFTVTTSATGTPASTKVQLWIYLRKMQSSARQSRAREG